MKALDRIFHKNQGFRHNKSAKNESGSVIVIIFVMIAILAALSFVLNQGTRSGANSLNQQQADLAATEILNYTNAVKNAVRNIRIARCDETEISFENHLSPGSYTNPNAPADNSCHVFHPNGGGISYQQPIAQIFDSAFSADGVYGHYYFSSRTTVTNMGDSGDELLMIMSFANEQVCQQINSRIFSDTTIISDPADFDKTGNVIGSFDTTASSVIDLSASAIQNGAPMACFESTTHNGYHIYTVLIAR